MDLMHAIAIEENKLYKLQSIADIRPTNYQDKNGKTVHRIQGKYDTGKGLLDLHLEENYTDSYALQITPGGRTIKVELSREVAEKMYKKIDDLMQKRDIILARLKNYDSRLEAGQALVQGQKDLLQQVEGNILDSLSLLDDDKTIG